MAEKTTDYEIIKSLRNDRDLSQRDLSDQTGITLGTIKAVETGRVQLNQEHAAILAEFFDVDSNSFYRIPKRKTCILALMIQKGGAGKTSISVNLAYALAEKGNQVLFIDTDAQMNSSATLGFRGTSHPDKNFFDAYVNNHNLIDYIQKTEYKNLDIIPSSHKMSVVEASTAHLKYREKHMDLFFENVRKEGVYDFVIIDTNPSLGSFNTSIMGAVDEIIVPTDPERYTIDMVELFFAELNKISPYVSNGRANIAGIVFNRHEKNVNVSKAIYESIKKRYPNLLFKTILHRGVIARESLLKDMPVAVFQPTGRMANEYRSLAKEVINIVKNRKS